METIKFHFRGVAPLMIQSALTVDPLNEWTKAIKAITSKPAKQKTDDDHREISRLEFMANIYWDESVGPFIPGENIVALIRDGGKHSRKGATIERGLIVAEPRVPIVYDGPRDLEQLFADKKFVDRRPVGVQASKTMRTRPIFRTWSLKFEAFFDPSILDGKDVRDIAETAGKYVGLGTFRPQHGRFEVV